MYSKRTSTKAGRRRALKKRERERDALVDAAVGALRCAITGAGLCLPSCVLLQRLLKHKLPHENFHVRLGSLHVHAQDGTTGVITFDPRTPDGIDGGFHSWLEDEAGKLLDPSITVTLREHGYDVDPNTYFLDDGRKFVRHGLLFIYEELPELELVGVEESEPQLAHLERMAITGENAPPGTVYLDVRWST